MRTFPKCLSTFQRIIKERGERLRNMDFEQLSQLNAQPDEHLTIESRPATISVIVQPKPDGGLRIVVRGFMKSRFWGKDVAMDGFYKHPDGRVTPMPDEEFYEFD